MILFLSCRKEEGKKKRAHRTELVFREFYLTSHAKMSDQRNLYININSIKIIKCF